MSHEVDLVNLKALSKIFFGRCGRANAGRMYGAPR